MFNFSNSNSNKEEIKTLNKDIIKVDIDGVIRDFMGSVYTTLKIMGRTDIPDNEPTINQWDFSSAYPDIPKDTLFRLVFNSRVKDVYYTNAKPTKIGINLIQTIKDEFPNSKIILRTHQSKESTTWTDKWLNKYKIPYDGIFYSNSTIDKNLISNTILIDDKWETIKKVNYGILVARDCNDIDYEYRTNSIEEIISYMKEMGM